MSSSNAFLTLIVEAVKSRDSRNVREALDQCARRNIFVTLMLSMLDGAGYSPIHYAVCQENLDILDQLLAHADIQGVNALDINGGTPILLLLCHNRSPAAEDMLVSLLRAGADPNLMLEPTVGYWCSGEAINHANLPLVNAVQNKRWRMAEILLEGGADPLNSNCMCHAIDFTMENPLLMRCLLDRNCFHPDLFGMVLNRDYEGRCERTALELCEMILPYHNNCANLNFGLIHDAATSGFYEVIVLMLTSLRPGISLPHTGLIPITLNKISKVLTLENYRRFLLAYFQFLDLNNYEGASYLHLLYTARKARTARRRYGRAKVSTTHATDSIHFLQILLEEAIRRDPDFARWKTPCPQMFIDMSYNNNEWAGNQTEICLWTNVEVDAHFFTMSRLCLVNDDTCFDFMSAVVYHVKSREAMAEILPTLVQFGLKFSPISIAAFTLRAVSESSVPERELLPAIQKLSSNCCCSKNRSCWFREHYFVKLCSEVLRTTYHRSNHKVLITLLRLGVDIKEVFCRFPVETYMNDETVAIIKHFEPRPVASWMSQPQVLEAPSKFEQRAPASLMALSRHAVRQSLGFCRVRDKLESSGLWLPRTLLDYVTFEDHITSAHYNRQDADPEGADASFELEFSEDDMF